MNVVDVWVARRVTEGGSIGEARMDAFEAYLSDKLPGTKASRKERDALFWSSQLVASASAEELTQEPAALALTRYLGQSAVVCEGLLDRMALEAPTTLILAVRRSRLVLECDSPHRVALRAAGLHCEAVAELMQILDIFTAAHLERQMDLETRREAHAALSPFELLILASLYAFEHLVPHRLDAQFAVTAAGDALDTHWEAIEKLLYWKLETAQPESLRLDEAAIGRALKRYLSPTLFPSHDTTQAADRIRREFAGLVAAQREMDEFLSRSIDAFCFDDAVRFVRVRDRTLEIAVVDAARRAKWERDGRKLNCLHAYWFYRAIEAFAESPLAGARFGAPENEDDNRLAWVRALASQLRLQSVYGVGDSVSIPGDASADLFHVLLTAELTSRFHFLNFIAPFAAAAEHGGDWRAALRTMAIGGLLGNSQNRLPLTWSSRDDKIRNITGWTVDARHPSGSAKAAAAMLDFWTQDLAVTATRLQHKTPGLRPRLGELPFLKFGRTLVQLPWITGVQNNSHAALNALRRLGSRRPECQDETRQVEQRVAEHLRARGFRVLCGWMPPAPFDRAGEVDIVAARDGHLFLFEVKSTYLRKTPQEAWRHAATTQRRAGLQLKRKRPAVLQALAVDTGFRAALGLDVCPVDKRVHTWIVDTSIESDHERFSGFLKVSWEEVLIALRDDAQLLTDPDGLVSGRMTVGVEVRSLYPAGFDASRFAEIIEGDLLWTRCFESN